MDTTRRSSRGAATGTRPDGSSVATGAPHAEQNLAVADSGLPHVAHRSVSGDPHSRQKRACGGFSVPHDGQGFTGAV